MVCLSDSSRLSLSGEYINEPLLDQASEIYAQVGGTTYPVTYAPLSDAEHSAIALGGLTLFTQFTFNGSTEGLQSGQYACVYVKYNQASQVLAVPINALYQDETGPYVYRIIQGKQTRTEVQTGIETALQVEITAGLQEGDVVFVKN